MNMTLVALYGQKPSVVDDLLRVVQSQLQSDCGDAFEPYALAQVHGTIVGLEGTRVGPDLFHTTYGQQYPPQPMDWEKILAALKDSSLLPLSIRLASYRSDTPYSFTSRGLHPYERSFSIQGEIAVVMGWPWDGQSYPASLDQLRRQFSAAHVLHKYHTAPDAFDNDFFLVLGRVRRQSLSDRALQIVQQRMRDFLANYPPIEFQLGRENLSFVAYSDPKLPLETSRVYSLEEVQVKWNEIMSLYPVQEGDLL